MSGGVRVGVGGGISIGVGRSEDVPGTVVGRGRGATNVRSTIGRTRDRLLIVHRIDGAVEQAVGHPRDT